MSSERLYFYPPVLYNLNIAKSVGGKIIGGYIISVLCDLPKVERRVRLPLPAPAYALFNLEIYLAGQIFLFYN